MGATREYTAWGTVVGTGAASIDLVLMEATRPMSVREIEEDMRRRGLPERGAISSHLNTLRQRGHIVNTPEGWCRVSLTPTGSSPTADRPVPATAQPSHPSASPTTPSNPPTPVATPVERLQRTKLVLEIEVAAVALIAGLIALIWGSR